MNIEKRFFIHFVVFMVCCFLTPVTVAGQVRFGLDFSPPEEGAIVPYGSVFPILDFMSPFDLTNPANQFVLDGAFAGRNDAEIRRAIRNRVEDLYRGVDTGDPDTTLAITFDEGFLAGPGSENIVLGTGQSGSERLGLAFLGTALDPSYPDGFAGSVILLNNIDDIPSVNYETFEGAINAIANVTAHEIGHNLSLKHVYVSGALPENPLYPVMASGALDLPAEALLSDAEFKICADAEEGGTQSATSMLLSSVGTVTLGDYNMDGLVNSSDLLMVSPFWHGTDVVFQEGDVDGDHDFDSTDLLIISELYGSGVLAYSTTPNFTIESDVVVQVVPEPSSFLLLGVMAWVGLLHHRHPK